MKFITAYFIRPSFAIGHYSKHSLMVMKLNFFLRFIWGIFFFLKKCFSVLVKVLLFTWSRVYFHQFFVRNIWIDRNHLIERILIERPTYFIISLEVITGSSHFARMRSNWPSICHPLKESVSDNILGAKRLVREILVARWP